MKDVKQKDLQSFLQDLISPFCRNPRNLISTKFNPSKVVTSSIQSSKSHDLINSKMNVFDREIFIKTKS